MTLVRRRTALFALAALAMAATVPARAEIKGLEIIAPANPGSGFDQTSRAVRDALQEAGLASGIQVLNVPGAGGAIGLAQFANGQNRGPGLLTIGVTTVGSILTTKPPVTLEDAAPLALLLREYSVVVVPANSDIKTLADLTAKVKANPASVTWAVGSAGGLDHVIAGQITKKVAGDASKTNAINYAGGGEQVAAILGGHVTAGVGGVPEFASQIKSGKLRALAVSSGERLAGLDVPTLKEQGVDVVIGTWRGLMARKQATDAERKELSAAIEKMVATPVWKASLERNGWIGAYQNAEGFGAFLKEQQAMMKTALGELGLLK
ncbi:Bug family tripartite tricarboxylate transporter substrate binding protein [Microvirga sp. G4-2]|uniref:Bug family tripartite tricarboxylate transporter substrate binding protein n=1 Tax=Microvirga sp. G4-2 TaxID=3434467 RepID=UPI0040446E0E